MAATTVLLFPRVVQCYYENNKRGALYVESETFSTSFFSFSLVSTMVVTRDNIKISPKSDSVHAASEEEREYCSMRGVMATFRWTTHETS